MKIIAVIGHIVKDRIINSGGEVVESPGGIANSLAALGVAADSATSILPVCSLGHDLYEEASSFFGNFPAIDFSLVRQIPIANKIHELRYSDVAYREEYNRFELPGITPAFFKTCGRIDAAILNYIGGDEFPPRYIRWLKDKYSPLIYLDYHSLALGRKYIHRDLMYCRRYFRYNPHWIKYVEHADILQLNHMELRSIYPGLAESDEAAVKAALDMHKRGPEITIVTREHRDLVIIHGRKPEPEIDLIPMRKPINAIDPTGCGDAFAAGFIVSYIKENDIFAACENGLKLAGKKIGFSGLGGYLQMLEDGDF